MRLLLKRLATRRAEHLEAMGKGLDPDAYRKAVGKVSEIDATVALVNELLKQAHNDDEQD